MSRQGTTIFAGTYTGSGSEGIYGFRFDPVNAEIEPLGCIAHSGNPSYLYRSQRTQTLYAVEETTGTSKADGSVLAYHVDEHNALLQLKNRVSSLGVGPCFLSTDASEKHLFVTNFHSGSITVIRLLPDGSLGAIASHVQLHGSSVHTIRQRSSHPHAIMPTQDGQHVIVADLGADALLIFKFDPSTGMLSERAVDQIHFSAGSGPRHIAVHPNGRFLYVIHEIKSVITVHTLGGTAIVGPAIQSISTVPDDGPEPSDAADILIDASGEWVYATSRLTSTIRVYSADRETGHLQTIQDAPSGGKTPQTLCLSPDQRWLLTGNLDSGSIGIFARSKGQLSQEAVHSVPSPSFLCCG